jgi:hypothetical protein
MYSRSIGGKLLANLDQLLRVLLVGAILILLGLLAYRLIVLPAPEVTGALPPQGPAPNILDKLGPQTSVGLIIVLIALVAWVFWLFIDFGRRLQNRGYLGPLTRDALARAEVTRQVGNLQEMLSSGQLAAEFEVDSEAFRKKYDIPEEAKAPPLISGVPVDSFGFPMKFDSIDRMLDKWRHILPTGMGEWGEYSSYDFDPYADEADEEVSPTWRKREQRIRELINQFMSKVEDFDRQNLWKERTEAGKDGEPPQAYKSLIIEYEIDKRFVEGFVEEQVDIFERQRANLRAEAGGWAEALVTKMDVSAFGGGWIFVLEFTTIIFIVFAALTLGFVGVLEADQIGTILAAIAGYVLGKSTTIRGPGGEEIQREVQVEAIQPVMDTVTKQTEMRFKYDEEKLQLQRRVEDLEIQLAKVKIPVPKVIGLVVEEAEDKVKEKGLVPEREPVVNPDIEEKKVFYQSPGPNTEVEKGSTVVLFVAMKPAEPKKPPEAPVEAEEPKKPPEAPVKAEEPKKPPEAPVKAEEPKKPPEAPVEAEEPEEPPEAAVKAEEPEEPPEAPVKAEEPKKPPEAPVEAEEPEEPKELTD